MPAWMRKIGWVAAFVALAARGVKGISELDDSLPQDQPATWPPLAFETVSYTHLTLPTICSV